MKQKYALCFFVRWGIGGLGGCVDVFYANYSFDSVL
jgi:hypothetical protein